MKFVKKFLAFGGLAVVLLGLYAWTKSQYLLALPIHFSMKSSLKVHTHDPVPEIDVTPEPTEIPSITPQKCPNRSKPRTEIPPSDSFRQIPDITALRTRFTNLTRDSCINTCDPCRTHCDANSLQQWLNIIDNKSLKTVQLFPENEYFFDWEKLYLNTPPLTDMKSLPSLTLSKVYFTSGDGAKTSKQDTKEVTMTKNRPAHFRVELRDKYDHRRTVGGDEVRAWLVGKTDQSPQEEVLATAEVKDLGDGSYDVRAMATWAGSARLQVSVQYPREYIRLAVHHFRIGLHRFLFGKFKNGGVEEVTLCHANPNPPGRTCLCNLTLINSEPMYCGRPMDKRLTCGDWTSTYASLTQGYKDATGEEIKLDKDISQSEPSKQRLIRNSINIQIKDRKSKTSLPPCTKVDRSISWTLPSPRGYWSQNKTLWNSLVCKEPPMTKEWIHSCLQSTNVWMVGDSNVRIMGLQLSEFIGCRDKDVNKYPLNSVCKNKQYNITVQFRSHEHPLYTGPHWLGNLGGGTVVDYISSIPSTGDHIVVLHYFLHFTATHLNVLLKRLQSLKSAVAALLSRNPNVIVAIRGPHTALQWKDYLMFAGDVLGSFMRRIHIETFRDLQDRVIFLDGWDQSICYQNPISHPNLEFTQTYWRTILSYKCD